MLSRLFTTGILLLLVKICTSQVSFERFTAIPTGSHAEVVEIGDFNQDGLNDVVIGNSFYFNPTNDYKLKIYIQDSLTGTFNQPIVHSYSSSAERINAICLGDVNQDGRQDIIVGAGNHVKLFYQEVNGGFSTYQEFFSGTRVNGIGFGDLNNDGIPDFAVSHWNENYIRIFYQDQFGFNQATYPKPAGGYDELKIADMNNDGRNDVVFMSGQQSSGLHIFFQNASGSLQSFTSFFPTETSWNSLNGFDTGDINNDGKVGMVASMGGNSPTAKMVIWDQHNSNGMITNNPYSISAYDIPEPVKIHDMNCDGKNEIITVHGGWTDVSIYEADTANQFYTYSKFPLPYASHYNPYGLALGDLNNDGREDIAIADYNNGLVLLYNNQTINNDNFTVSDSIISYDTTFIRKEDSLVWTVNDTSWDKGGWRFFQTDSLYTNFTSQFKEVNYHEYYYKSQVYCSKTYFDTIQYDSSYIVKSLTNEQPKLASRTIDSVNVYSDLKVYPNPNNGRFFIELPNPWNDRELGIFIYDNKGRLVMNKKIAGSANNIMTIDLGIISAGEYHLRLFHKNKLIAHEKLIIMKKS